MNHKSILMKKLLLYVMTVLAVVGCRKKDIENMKDDVSDLKTRVTILEEQCKQNNTNIVALQSIVNASNEGDYVTSVTPITKDGVEIGYTIAFKKQSPITIYHGTNGINGTNGSNGTNGEAPIIGVSKFEGVYYWTLNGDWLLDDNGGKIRVIGENGTNGTNGENGITPQLKVEDDNWYISYDNGETWNFASQAKGDKGDQGDAMFKEVTADDGFVYFTLADDTSLKVARHNSPVSIEKGAIKAPFSVAEGKQVYFSMGNLQYNAKLGTHVCADGTTQQGTWRFALNQWEKIGEDNQNIAQTYNGWIDLFGWGTSGWAESGAICYQPWSCTSTNSNYYVGGAYENSLTGIYANADWGVYNPIINGGNETGLWRTLSKEEWLYLINERPNASKLRAVGTVNGVNGLILLPDNWVQPETISFRAGFATKRGTEQFLTQNCYNATQWSRMEEKGACFLPAAGYNGYCYYWSTSPYDESTVWNLDVTSEAINSGNAVARCKNKAVRLVQDVK